LWSAATNQPPPLMSIPSNPKRRLSSRHNPPSSTPFFSPSHGRSPKCPASRAVYSLLFHSFLSPQLPPSSGPLVPSENKRPSPLALSVRSSALLCRNRASPLAFFEDKGYLAFPVYLPPPVTAGLPNLGPLLSGTRSSGSSSAPPFPPAPPPDTPSSNAGFPCGNTPPLEDSRFPGYLPPGASAFPSQPFFDSAAAGPPPRR